MQCVPNTVTATESLPGPIISRALGYYYPVDAAAVALGDEHLYGRDILVAVVVEKGASARSLYLPQGCWYDFWNVGEAIALRVHPTADGSFALYEYDGKRFEYRKGEFMQINGATGGVS